MVPSFEVFGSLTKPAVWARVNATRSEVNKFYDMGFEVEQNETEVAALQRQLAEMTAALEADNNKSNSNRKGSKKVKPRKAPGKGTEAGAALVAGKIGDVHVLLEDSAGHLGQDSIDLVRDGFDQNVEKYGGGSISEVDMLAVTEDELVTIRQAIAESKNEAKKARELAAKGGNPRLFTQS